MMRFGQIDSQLSGGMAVLLTALLLWSCTSEQPVQPGAVSQRDIEPEECVWPDAPEEEAPNWVCDYPYGNFRFTATGSDESDKTIAEADARSRLARAMRVYVKNMVKRYVERTGTGDSQTIDKVSVDVSTHVTAETLHGSRILVSRVSPNRWMYVVVGLDEAGALESVSEAARTSYRNLQADWQRILQGKREDQMDAEIQELMRQEQETVTPRTQSE